MSTTQSQRRILLVDNDRAFQRLLSDQIGPYGFEVVNANPADPDVLAKVTQVDPALVIIAVDEPDKVGYSLCNKAKKGVAANLPVILATATVSPEGFANHRRLKLHADEYIDKRGLNPAEVVGKIDNLIGLGEAVDASVSSERLATRLDELQLPVEVEDLPLDLGDAEIVEQLDDASDPMDDGATSILTAHPFDNDLEGAFAAITEFADVPDAADTPEPHDTPDTHDTPEDARPALEAKPQGKPLPRQPSRGRRTEPPPLPRSPGLAHVVPQTRASDYVGDEPSMGIPEPIAHDASDADAQAPAEEWHGQVPEPIDSSDFGGDERTSAGGPPLADMLNGGGVPMPVPEPEPPSEAVAAPQVAAPEAIAATAPQAAPVPPAPAPAVAESPADAALATLAAIPAPKPKPPAEPSGLDLGLEEVAARADAEQSAITDRRTLQKVHLLERENARLKGELDKAARHGDGAKPGREREFLHLREMIAGKDKELLELRDELVAKDRSILDGKEKLRQLQHVKAQLEGRNLEIEQRLVGDADRVEHAEAQRKELEVRLADVTSRLSTVETKAKADAEAAARTLAERTQQATQLDKELAVTRARLGDLEHKHADQLAGLGKMREAELNHQRIELERARDEAIAAARAELASAHAVALADADQRHDEAIAAREQAAQAALAAAREQAEQRLAEVKARDSLELDAARSDAEKTLAGERARAEKALADEQARAEQALAAERARADQAVADAAEHVQEATAAERARAEQAIAEARNRAQDDLLAIVATHQGEMEKATAEREAAIAAVRKELDDKLAAARGAAIADRDRLIAEHGSALRVLTEDRDKVQAELDALRVEAEGIRAEKAEVERGLSSARTQLTGVEGQLAAAQGTIEAKEREIAAQVAAIAERDQRIAQLRGELDALEQENSGYQEQVLKAYQKIKADEVTVARAKKAMAIALTLLDEEKGSEKTSG